MGHNWADEHPIQMKAVEIGLGAACSLVSTIVVSWVTAKINAHYKKKRDEKIEQEEKEEAMEKAEAMMDEFFDDKLAPYIDSAIDVATEMAVKYGKDWQNIPEAREEANSMLDDANPF